MADSKNNREKKSIHFSNIKSLLTLNIGTVIFAILFLYLVISAIIYFTSSHVSTYQVTSGPLEKNQTYTAIILRSESVQTAHTNGFINYYAREGYKTKKGGVLYTLSTEKKVSSSITLDNDDFAKLKVSIADFANSFDSNSFRMVYSFKSSLESDLFQYSSPSLTTSDSSEQRCYAEEDGIVLYTLDGYENKDVTQISDSDFDLKEYENVNLKSLEYVNLEEPVCKIIDSEAWSIVMQISDTQATLLSEFSTIRVKFLKDGATQTGNLTILSNPSDGKRYAQISFDEGMIRYVSDRYTDVELVTTRTTGLKIPVSSIVKKDFYLVPSKFETFDDDEQEAGFFRIKIDDDGKEQAEFVSTTVYRTDNNYSYIDKNDFNKGDIIVSENLSDRYTVEKTASLEGVYCINKGYAIFRQIDIEDSDEEYCIVKSGLSYSISQFDHIVLNGSEVKEDQIIYN